jgi:predicted amidohydrolase
MNLNIHAWTFDVGCKASSPLEYAEHLMSRVEQSWAEGADVTLFPEYTWAGLERFLPEPDLHQVSRLFWQEIWPLLQKRLTHPEKMVALGTTPWLDPDTHQLHNRCPILIAGEIVFQDKLHLTPWEKDFSPGKGIHTFDYKGLRGVVFICLDVEMPELSAALRKHGSIDFVLVPSATENALGVERVNRCASARAVELGCPVIVSHLVGQCSSTLVDENVGYLAAYLPSQSVTSSSDRMMVTPLCSQGFRLAKFPLSNLPMHSLLSSKLETNPAQLVPAQAAFIIHHYT